MLRQEVFDHLPGDGDLVADACGALAKQGRLVAYPYRGYWQPADTVKERAALDAAYAAGDRPVDAVGETVPRHGADRCALILTLHRPVARESSCSARTATTSPSARAAPCSRCAAANPGCASTPLVLTGGGTPARGRGTAPR